MAETLLQSAKKLLPLIRANLDRIDSECQLPPELAEAMSQKGLFGLYVPKALGGPESDPITAFHVVEAISSVDGSAGWCSFNGTALTAAVSRITIAAAKELFGDPPEVSGSAAMDGTTTGSPVWTTRPVMPSPKRYLPRSRWSADRPIASWTRISDVRRLSTVSVAHSTSIWRESASRIGFMDVLKTEASSRRALAS